MRVGLDLESWVGSLGLGWIYKGRVGSVELDWIKKGWVRSMRVGLDL